MGIKSERCSIIIPMKYPQVLSNGYKLFQANVNVPGVAKYLLKLTWIKFYIVLTMMSQHCTNIAVIRGTRLIAVCGVRIRRELIRNVNCGLSVFC